MKCRWLVKWYDTQKQVSSGCHVCLVPPWCVVACLGPHQPPPHCHLPPPPAAMQSRDTGRLAEWQAEGAMSRIGLNIPLNAGREIKRDQQSTTHKQISLKRKWNRRWDSDGKTFKRASWRLRERRSRAGSQRYGDDTEKGDKEWVVYRLWDYFPLSCPSGQCLSFRLGHSDIYVVGI